LHWKTAVCIGASLVSLRASGQAKKPSIPPTQGHAQMAGGNGEFGVTYTLKNDINLVIYSARYTLEPFDCQIWTAPTHDQKLFECDLAFKNAAGQDKATPSGRLITLVDSTGASYGTDARYMAQDSQGSKGYMPMLHPGQGIGQPGLHDPLHIIAVVPAKARIVKLLFNYGRKFAKPDEEVIRYYIAGATKEEAGADGDPKNVVAPLPAYAADPADKSGAIALDEGKASVGQEYPSEGFHIKLNSAAFSMDSLMGSPPKKNMKYVVLNVTAQLMVDTDALMSTLAGNFDPLWQLTDGDGEHYKPSGFLKASSDDEANHKFKLHDTYTFRVVFSVPQAATIKNVIIAAHQGREWTFDGSVVH
jgi:hypothetical protein